MSKKGFTYIWYDKLKKRYYIGCHWGTINDGYICSSPWMKKAYLERPNDFKRRILKANILSKVEMFDEELRLLKMIKLAEIKPFTNNPRYYNLNITNNEIWHKYDENIKTIGQKISASKKGKNTGPRDPSVGEAISKAKKESFKRRKEKLGYTFTLDHAEKIASKNRGRKHSDETKAKHSKDMKEQWENGIRKSNGSPSEETKNKISKALMGIKRENVENYRTAHSKKYSITMNDGSQILINGLKKYGLENNIPYVTLFKAAQHSTRIPKYNIQSINLV